ncbi:MAG: zf-HC2 domain-containing protein [Candidatus Latescibacteria bacterium]|nr:zf-HC2 domain-containing protein [Candidatus Latescibacterota bacterium]
MTPYDDCRPFQDQFGDYLLGRLSPAEALGFAQHLRDCAACRQALALERRLRAVPPVAAPADLAAAVLAQRLARPAPSGWIRSTLGNTAADAAFRTLVDPLLQLDLELRGAGAPLRRLVAGALAGLQSHLYREGNKLGQRLALPLLDASRQVRAALAGPPMPQ